MCLREMIALTHGWKTLVGGEVRSLGARRIYGDLRRVDGDKDATNGEADLAFLASHGIDLCEQKTTKGRLINRSQHGDIRWDFLRMEDEKNCSRLPRWQYFGKLTAPQDPTKYVAATVRSMRASMGWAKLIDQVKLWHILQVDGRAWTPPTNEYDYFELFGFDGEYKSSWSNHGSLKKWGCRNCTCHLKSLSMTIYALRFEWKRICLCED